jgi:hypothetical protein
MKRTLVFTALRFVYAALFLAAHQLTAQTYYHVTSTSGTFTPLTGATVIDFQQSDDMLSEQIDLPFSFEYFGVERQALKASTNGFITFDVNSTDPRFSNQIELCDEPLIAPLWDDLSPATSGVASYRVDGSTPDRIFTIEFLNWHWPYNHEDSTMSFQVKLYETSNVIEFIYRAEAEMIFWKTASIGIMDASPGRFYSVSSYWGNLVSYPENANQTQPSDGDTYSFTPGPPPEMPSIQASLLSVSEITDNSANLTWTRGNGEFELIAIKESSGENDSVPTVDGEQYYTGELGNGWYHVATIGQYRNDSTWTLNLRSGYTYQVAVIDFNGAGGFQRYNSSTGTNNPIEFSTTNSRPVSNATLQILHHSTSSVAFSRAAGDGEFNAIFIKGGTTDVPPEIPDSVFYSAATYGTGGQIGTSGWYCVFRGVRNPIELSGLPPDSALTVAVVDFNGAPGRELYLVSPTLFHFKTFSAKTANYAFTKSVDNFVELTGSTALDEIEVDDEMSENIPIGFQFLYNGESFDTLRVSSNGFLTFNLTAPASSMNTDMTFNRLKDNYFSPLLAPLWDDLSGNGGEASYKTEGAPGSRVFTVEFKNWKWNYAAAGPTISFQVKLYETDNRIEYRYRQESSEVNSGSASIGLSFFDLEQTLTLSSSGADAEIDQLYESGQIGEKPATNQVFTFTPGPARLNQTITFQELGIYSFDPTKPILLHASSTSGLPVTFTSSNENVMTVSGDTARMINSGGAYIIASQQGNDMYHPAEAVEQYADIAQSADTVYFDSLADVKYSDGSIELNATSFSDNPVVFESSDHNVASVSGNILTFVAPGTVEITAKTNGSYNYKAASQTRTLVVLKGDQVIQFDELGVYPYSNEPVELTALSSSGLTVSYESSDPAVVAISEGSKLVINGLGIATITASVSSNLYYNAADPVAREITIVKGNQAINFPEFGGKKALGEVIVLDSLSSSLLVVIYSTVDDDVIQIEGNIITVIGRGSAVITATQPGNENYLAAESVTRELIVKTAQTISFEVSDHTDIQPFMLSATASSGLPVTYKVLKGGISIDADEVTALVAGQASIKASQAGNDEYDSALSVISDFCINPGKPIITLNANEGMVLTSSSGQGNNWLKDEMPLNFTGVDLIVETSGSYQVTTTINGCTSEPSDAFALTITTTENYLDHEIGFSPNPVKDLFIVDASNSNMPDVSVDMYDVLGRKLESWSGRGKIECHIGQYDAGNYVIHIRTAKTFSRGRIIKQ